MHLQVAARKMPTVDKMPSFSGTFAFFTQAAGDVPGLSDLLYSDVSTYLVRLNGGLSITVIDINSGREVTVDVPLRTNIPYDLKKLKKNDEAVFYFHDEDFVLMGMKTLKDHQLLQANRRRSVLSEKGKVVIRIELDTPQPEEDVGFTVDLSSQTPVTVLEDETPESSGSDEFPRPHEPASRVQIDDPAGKILGSGQSVRVAQTMSDGQEKFLWITYAQVRNELGDDFDDGLLASVNELAHTNLDQLPRQFFGGIKNYINRVSFGKWRLLYSEDTPEETATWGSAERTLRNTTLDPTSMIGSNVRVNMDDILSVVAISGYATFIIVTKDKQVYFQRFWADVLGVDRPLVDVPLPDETSSDVSTYSTVWRLEDTNKFRKKRPVSSKDPRPNGKKQRVIVPTKSSGHHYHMNKSEVTCWRSMCDIVDGLPKRVTHKDERMAQANREIWMIVKRMPPCKRQREILTCMREDQPVITCKKSLSQWLIGFGLSLGVNIQ